MRVRLVSSEILELVADAVGLGLCWCGIAGVELLVGLLVGLLLVCCWYAAGMLLACSGLGIHCWSEIAGLGCCWHGTATSPGLLLAWDYAGLESMLLVWRCCWRGIMLFWNCAVLGL